MTPDRIVTELQQATYDDLLDALTTCQLRDIWLWAATLDACETSVDATRAEIEAMVGRAVFRGDDRGAPVDSRLVDIATARIGRLPKAIVDLMVLHIEAAVLTVGDPHPSLADWAFAVSHDLHAEYQRRLKTEHETPHGSTP
jgi:hypothetical protein